MDQQAKTTVVFGSQPDAASPLAGRAGAAALGRKLPVYESTGPPRPNKTLGMFYFQVFDSRGDGPYDN